jgi:phosphatidylinositol alpha-mannosyltransferase
VVRITLSLRIEHNIKEVFEREKFDICHLHEPLMPTLCTTVLRLKKAPMVGTFHASGGKPWYELFSPVMKFYLRRWWNKLDGRIAVSPVARDYINKSFPADYTIIPNGIDTHHFNNGVKPLEEYNDGKANIVFVSRFEKRKGFDYLLEAYRLLKPEIPHSRLIAVGPGVRLRKKYEKRVRQQGLKDVHFTGYVNFADLPRYYKTADVVCFPATGWESFGIVLLEAMSVGKPIIASNINGFNAVLSDGVDGLAVRPRNSWQLAEAIVKLINDRDLCCRMAEKGKEKALNYDWSVLAGRILDFYQETLDKIKDRETAPATGEITGLSHAKP